MKFTIFKIVLAFIVSVFWYDHVLAETSYIEAEPIVRKPPIYPSLEARSSNAGMVEVEMMIDKEGKIFAPIVIRSSSKAFEQSAINAVSKYEYKPALKNGSPVVSRASIRIRYEMTRQQDAVSRKFASIYKKALAELDSQSPNKMKLERLISRLQKSDFTSTYTLVRYNLILVRYAMLYESPYSQIQAIESLLVFDDVVAERHRMLDEKIQTQLRATLFSLLITTQRFSEALALYDEYLIDAGESDGESDGVSYKELADSIAALADDDQVVATPIRLNGSGYTLESLFKRTIALYDLEGAVSKLIFRCDSHYAELPFNNEAEYKIPEGWGKCKIEIRGAAKTRAKLAQY